MKPASCSLALVVALAACGGGAPPAPQTSADHAQPARSGTAAPTASLAALEGVERGAFNRAAAELALPIFWTADTNGDGKLQPAELDAYWGLDHEASRATFVRDGAFTPRGVEALEAIAKHTTSMLGFVGDEGARRAAVHKELAQGRVTLVASDFSKVPAGEKQMVRHVLRAADLIERVFAKQMGTYGLEARVPKDDPASKTLFFRTHGPRCEAPLTQNDPTCAAFPDAPRGKLSGLYPARLLAEKDFCASLGKGDKRLVDPFTVVVEGKEKNELVAVPYHEAFAPELKEIAGELKSAAAALGDDEAPFRAYLAAAAEAFTTGSWFKADEAWAKMSVANSKYYLRVGPDEVYSEPCSTKALFHVSFGLINQSSLGWQKKLDPLKAEMEGTLAKLAGAPYKARDVSFHLPDFIDVVLNAGDSRNAFGATVGQSLPNFGPVANEGRGRTVAMVNLYTDADSTAAHRETAASLLCSATMSAYTDDKEPGIMSVVLHEAAHNLGPAHQYKVAGKIDREQFGGPLASTMEELKAQTAALYFTDWLATKSLITADDARKAHVRDLSWSFGHISRGMFTDDGHPKNYSQLAAIQLGTLLRDGAVVWKASETAANGKDKGCLDATFEKLPKSIEALMKRVAGVKGRGDRKGAEAMVAEFVTGKSARTDLHKVIAERVLRAPKASFVYAPHLD